MIISSRQTDTNSNMLTYCIKQYQQRTAEKYFNYWDYFREREFDTKKSNDSFFS